MSNRADLVDSQTLADESPLDNNQISTSKRKPQRRSTEITSKAARRNGDTLARENYSSACEGGVKGIRFAVMSSEGRCEKSREL